MVLVNRRGQPGIYGGYPNIQPPPMHRSLQSIEHASNAPQNFTGNKSMRTNEINESRFQI